MKTFLLLLTLTTFAYGEPKEVNCDVLASLCSGCFTDTDCQECLDNLLENLNAECSFETLDNFLGEI